MPRPPQVKIELFLSPENAKMLYSVIRAGSKNRMLSLDEVTTLNYIEESIERQSALYGVRLRTGTELNKGGRPRG